MPSCYIYDCVFDITISLTVHRCRQCECSTVLSQPSLQVCMDSACHYNEREKDTMHIRMYFHFSYTIVSTVQIIPYDLCWFTNFQRTLRVVRVWDRRHQLLCHKGCTGFLPSSCSHSCPSFLPSLAAKERGEKWETHEVYL